MKKTVLLIIALLWGATSVFGQRIPQSVDIIRKGYWEVQSPDTLTRHTDAIQSVERVFNLTYQGIHPDSIQIHPPTYRIDQQWTDATTDTIYVHQTDTLYNPDEPVYVNSEPNFNHETALTNGIFWQFQTDSLQGVRLKLFGQTPAERVSVGIKCVGVDSAGMFTDQRTGFSMTPDANNVVQQSSKWLDKTCNQFMTYWITAYTTQDTAQVSRFVDVGEAWAGRDQF